MRVEHENLVSIMDLLEFKERIGFIDNTCRYFHIDIAGHGRFVPEIERSHRS